MVIASMSAVAKRLLEEARTLPEDERRALAFELLEDGPDDRWTAELVRRAQDALEPGAELLDADAVHAEVLSKLRAARKT
jgi:hypothetical protein